MIHCFWDSLILDSFHDNAVWWPALNSLLRSLYRLTICTPKSHTGCCAFCNDQSFWIVLDDALDLIFIVHFNLTYFEFLIFPSNQLTAIKSIHVRHGHLCLTLHHESVYHASTTFTVDNCPIITLTSTGWYATWAIMQISLAREVWIRTTLIKKSPLALVQLN